MYIIIADNQIAGTSDTQIGLPNGWSLVPYETSDISNLYWDGTSVLLKPQKPTEDSYWDTLSNTWVTPQVTTPEPVRVTQDPLVVAIYDHIKQIDEPLADVIGLLFARLQGDTSETQIRTQRLIEQFTES